MSNVDHNLKIYSEEDIEFFMAGDRREIDRLLLHGVNNLAKVLITHANREEEIITELGTLDEVRDRARWVDTQIEAQRTRTNMMRKVAESSVVWAVIALLGFIAKMIYDLASRPIYEILKTVLHLQAHP